MVDAPGVEVCLETRTLDDGLLNLLSCPGRKLGVCGTLGNDGEEPPINCGCAAAETRVRGDSGIWCSGDEEEWMGVGRRELMIGEGLGV